jgi:hypothetical protein
MLMFSIRGRFTYANVVATLALVFAMSGGALAASKYLITSTKQIKPSVLASLKGKAGKAGANGAQGPAGAVGPAGPAGGVGPAGPAGAPGANGEPGPEGKEGKAGKNGTNGKEGSPWTAGGTLPAGATETGVWSMAEIPSGTTTGTLKPMILRTVISFPIPLAKPIEEGSSAIHVFEGTTIPSGCSGKVEGTQVTDLKADTGHLCIGLNTAFGALTTDVDASQTTGGKPVILGAGGVGTHGLVLSVGSAKEGARAVGVWAVTG